MLAHCGLAIVQLGSSYIWCSNNWNQTIENSSFLRIKLTIWLLIILIIWKFIVSLFLLFFVAKIHLSFFGMCNFERKSSLFSYYKFLVILEAKWHRYVFLAVPIKYFCCFLIFIKKGEQTNLKWTVAVFRNRYDFKPSKRSYSHVIIY